MHLRRVEVGIGVEDVGAHAVADRDHRVRGEVGRALDPGRQPVAAAELVGLPRPAGLQGVGGDHVRDAVQQRGRAGPAALAYQVWVCTRSAPPSAAAISTSTPTACSAPFAAWSPAGTACAVASGRGAAEAVDVDRPGRPAASAARRRGARRAPPRLRRRPAATHGSRSRCARGHPRGRNAQREWGERPPAHRLRCATCVAVLGFSASCWQVVRGSGLPRSPHDRAKPAVPFGGNYRLIDFVLSNLVNAEIRQIAVLTQYKSHSLDRHITQTWRMSPAARQLRDPGAGAAAARPALVHRQRRRDLPEPQPDLRRASRRSSSSSAPTTCTGWTRRRWSTSTCRPVPA